MILRVTRSSVKMSIGEKTITIGGEGLRSAQGEPDFVVTKSDVDTWDSPYDSITISQEEKKDILQLLVKEMLDERGIVVEIEWD